MRLRAIARNRWTMTGVLCAAVAGVTACGGATGHSASGASSASARPSARPSDPLSALSADQILAKAVSNLKMTSSVHLSGPATVSGQGDSLDITLVHTAGCQGSISHSGGKGSMSFIEIGKTFWFKPDKQLLTSLGVTDPAVLSPILGRYIKTSINNAVTEGVGPFCDPDKLAGELVSGTPHGLTLGARSTIGGQPVQELHLPGQQGSVWVSVAAQPELVRIVAPGGGGMSFTSYDAPVHLAAPPASQTVDGTQLGM